MSVSYKLVELSVTANAGEINILDGVTNVTSSNINHLSGVESFIKKMIFLQDIPRYKQMINLVQKKAVLRL